MRRVVVTGLGLMTSLGNSAKKTWDNIISSKSGIKKIPDSLFDTSNIPCKIAGYIDSIEKDPINGFDPDKFGITPSNAKRMDRFISFGIAAAIEAIEDSGIDLTTVEQQNRAGTLIGSGIGGLIKIQDNCEVLFKKGPGRIHPYFIPGSLINLIAGQVSIRYNLKGPNFAIATACATGAHSIGEAARLIQCGDADIMVCGGSEAAICPLGMAGFANMKALSTQYNDTPEQASRPWDKGRDGFVMGEGAGIVVLEDYESAKKRSAKIYAELTGYGLSGDAYHITAPQVDGDGATRAINMALGKSGVAPQNIDYINAHGTSTPLGDGIEYHVIESIFKDTGVAVSSTKSALGHLLGGSGSVEAILTILALINNIAPPTLNLYDPDEAFSTLNLVPNTMQEKSIKHALSNSFGFGGTNAALLFSKIQFIIKIIQSRSNLYLQLVLNLIVIAYI